MVLTLVWGAYSLFFSSPPQSAPISSSDNGLEQLNTFITQIAATSKTGLSETEAHILKQAESEWEQDPFVSVETTRDPQFLQNEAVVEQIKPDYQISYTGYMQMGNTRLAIINGMEYEVGDKLEPGGYLVRTITSTQIVLVATKGKRKKFVLPLEDTQ